MTQNGQKHKNKKLFFSAPERARTVLKAFLECMYFDKMYIDPIESIGSNRLDQIDRIDSIRLQKWICGQILSCLDLN
jgi:hypothetical protein